MIKANMNNMVYEIFDHVNQLVVTDRPAALDFLRVNRSRTTIEYYLRLNFDPQFQFNLPPGIAPYKKRNDVPEGYGMTDLKQEMRRIRIFLVGAGNINKVRVEHLWLQMCEGLFWKEADLINLIKDHRLTDMYPNLTADLIREAFPTLLPEVLATPVTNEPLPVTQAVLDDPTQISELELIRRGIEEFQREEEEAKKAGAGVVATAPAKERKKPGPKKGWKNALPPVPAKPQPVAKKKPGPKPKPKAA